MRNAEMANKQDVINAVLQKWIDNNEAVGTAFVNADHTKSKNAKERIDYRWVDVEQMESFKKWAQVAELNLPKFSTPSAIFRAVMLDWAEEVLKEEPINAQEQTNENQVPLGFFNNRQTVAA